MPKLNANSRNNAISTIGILDLINDKVDQYILHTSDVQFNSLDVTTDATVRNDLLVLGNLTVSGNTSILNTDLIELKDNIILINSAETGAGVTLNLSGTEVERGSFVNFQAVYEESTDLYKIGEVANLQAVATREDNPLNKGVLVYNSTVHRLDSTTTLELPMSFTGAIESTSSITGTLRITGGIGMTGNIYTDKGIYLKGNTGNYQTNIISNVTNDLLLNTGRNTVFNNVASTEIQVAQLV